MGLINVHVTRASYTGIVWQSLLSLLFMQFVSVDLARGESVAPVASVFDLLNLPLRSYGDLPDIQELIAAASKHTEPAKTGVFGSTQCPWNFVILGSDSMFDFVVTKDPESSYCAVFVKTIKNSKLMISGSDGGRVKLQSCDQEYLHINDGSSIESTLCNIDAEVSVEASDFLLLQYERSSKNITDTAFTLKVTSVPDRKASADAVISKQIDNQQLEQICHNCGYSNNGAGVFRVLGGSFARQKDYPYMVAVYMLKTRPDGKIGVGNCGGSILDRRHVLTAAHCVNEDGNPAGVRLFKVFVIAGSVRGFGKQEMDANAQKVDVESWFSHPLYNGSDEELKSYDITIMRLSKELTFNEYVKPVCLPSPERFLGYDATLTGFGFSPTEIGGVASHLQEVKLNIRPAYECEEVYKRISRTFRFQDHQVCLHTPGKDACRGDSGGPVVLRRAGKFHQVGIVSFGLSCDDNHEKRTGIYARVSSFIPWIKDIIKSATC